MWLPGFPWFLIDRLSVRYFLRKTLLDPRNDVILETLAQVYKISAVPSDPDREPLMFFRVFLGIKEGIFIYDIELDMGDPQVSPGFQVVIERLLVLPFEKLGQEFLIE